MKLQEVIASPRDEGWPLSVSMIQKVLDSGACIRYIKPRGGGFSFQYLRFLRDENGQPESVQFMSNRVHPDQTPFICDQKHVGTLERLKLKKQPTKEPDGRDLWHLFDTKYINEGADEHIFASMFRKIMPKIKERKVYFQASADNEPMRILSAQDARTFSSDELVFDINVEHSNGETWAASLPPIVWDDFTIVRHKLPYSNDMGWLVRLKDIKP